MFSLTKLSQSFTDQSKAGWNLLFDASKWGQNINRNQLVPIQEVFKVCRSIICDLFLISRVFYKCETKRKFFVYMISSWSSDFFKGSLKPELGWTLVSQTVKTSDNNRRDWSFADTNGDKDAGSCRRSAVIARPCSPCFCVCVCCSAALDFSSFVLFFVINVEIFTQMFSSCLIIISFYRWRTAAVCQNELKYSNQLNSRKSWTTRFVFNMIEPDGFVSRLFFEFSFHSFMILIMWTQVHIMFMIHITRSELVILFHIWCIRVY